MKRTFKVIGWTLLVVVLLVLAVPALLLVPAVQQWTVQRLLPLVNRAVPEMQLEVGSFRWRYPLDLELHEVLARYTSTGDTLAYVGHFRASVTDYPHQAQPDWVVDALELQRVVLDLDTTWVQGLDLQARFQSLLVDSAHVGLDDLDFRLRALSLQQPEVQVSYTADTLAESDTVPTWWSVAVQQLQLADGAVTYQPWQTRQLQLAAHGVFLSNRKDSLVLQADADVRTQLVEADYAQYPVSAHVRLQVANDSCRLDTLQLQVPGYLQLLGQGQASALLNNDERCMQVQLEASVSQSEQLLSDFALASADTTYRLPSALDLTVHLKQVRNLYSARAEVWEQSMQARKQSARLQGRFDALTERYGVDLWTKHLFVSDFVPGVGLHDVNLALQVNGQLDANDKYGTQAAFNLQLDSLAYVENDSTLLQAAADLQGSWQRSVLDVQSNLWLTIPDLGNFDALQLNFRGEPRHVRLDLQGGDAEVRLQADCALEELQAVADKVMHELDMQTTRQAFDINALQQTIPTLQLEVDMAQQNPIMPLLQRYGVKFDQAKVLLTNADSLHLDLNIDTLQVEEHRLAHVDAHLVPKWGNYDYLAHVVYNDTLTGLDYALQLQARLQSDLIAARGNLWADTLQVLSFGANLTQRIDASARLERLPLSMVNPFLPENIRLEGALMGQAVWQCDSVDFDALRAAVWFDSAHVWYEGCDLTLGLPSDSIVYQGGQVLFNSVRFPTASKNPIEVNGVIDLEPDPARPLFNLKVTADQAQVLKNYRRKTKEQFLYGKLPLSAYVTVTGPLDHLKVDGQLQIPAGCDLTYFYEDDALLRQSQLNDLVEFKTFANQPLPELDTLEIRTPRVPKEAQRVDVNLKIRIDKQSQVQVFLPTGVDDKVLIQGGGDLLLGMNEAGAVRLTGMYEVADGDISFKLPMLPVTKQFNLDKDGYVRWSGVAEEPDLYLTASQAVKCTINSTTSGTRVVKFVVSVLIRGTLEEMDVVFDCSAPDDADMQSELASLTAEDRTKQALLLLVAQTYSGPSASSANAGMASANAAISNLLNKEIESLLTNKLKHTEINVGIDTYDATGTGSQQTDYSVSVSQKLFNDRMRVTVGGKMSTGDQVEQNNAEIINDVSMEWLINADGSHFVRLFRKVNYESVLEGEVVETGVGYVQQRSAFKFWQLFIPNSRKRAAAREAMIQKLREEQNEKKEE